MTLTLLHGWRFLSRIYAFLDRNSIRTIEIVVELCTKDSCHLSLDCCAISTQIVSFRLSHSVQKPCLLLQNKDANCDRRNSEEQEKQTLRFAFSWHTQVKNTRVSLASCPFMHQSARQTLVNMWRHCSSDTGLSNLTACLADWCINGHEATYWQESALQELDRYLGCDVSRMSRRSYFSGLWQPHGNAG